MKLIWISLALVMVLIPACLSSPVLSADQGSLAFLAQEQILIKFKTGLSEDFKQTVHRRYGGSVVSNIAPLGVQVVKLPRGSTWNTLLRLVSAYRSEVGIEFAEPDYVARAIFVPNDPGFGNQWGTSKIQAPAAWDFTRGSSATRIAICDTGIDQNHEDLTAKIVANRNFTYSSTADDLYGHGTHVAGIAAAITHNNAGVAGLGFNSSLMNVKVLGDNGSGYYSWIAGGITWAADNGAKVINLSLAGSSTSTTLANAISYAWNKGVVIVTAAGNNGNTSPVYPAYYSKCMAVAATDRNDARASWSTYGSWVDVAAPGVDIYSTLPNHSNSIGPQGYGTLSGTSMAAPHVAGLAALVWSTTYGTSNSAVRSRIETTADRITGTGSYWQNGRINAYQAVFTAAPPPPLPLPTPVLGVVATAPGLTNQASFSVQAKISNSGSGTATGTTATLTLPPGSSTGDPLARSLGDIAPGGSTTASWSVTAASSGQYIMKVNATASNAAVASGTATTTVDITPPAQVNGLSVTTAGATQLNLAWNANSETDLNHYNVYRGNASGGPYSPIASRTTNSYLDTGLTPNTTYYYVTTAIDNAGNEGPKSGEAFGKTNPLPVNNKMHISRIDMALKSYYFLRYATATVSIVDAGGSPVSGATVGGRWSGVVSGTASGKTNSSGQVTFTSNYSWAYSGAKFTFTVDSVSLTGWTYDSASNVVSSGSITVP